MQVLANENLLAVLMDHIDDPQTMFHLVLALPNAKATFERCPRQFLMAALSNLPTEINLLAILHIMLGQEHVTRASMIPILWAYLRLDDAPGDVVPPVVVVEHEIPRHLSNPFETLRKLAAVCNAVENLTIGYVEHSIEFVQSCSAADATDSKRPHYRYGYGYRFLLLSDLWNPKVTFNSLSGYEDMDKPQPWSLPPKASEIYRVKRALWRLEIFANVSHERHTFPNDGTLDSGDAENYCANPLGRASVPKDHDEGTRMLLASLQAFELAELESVYDYLWREIIKKVYRHKIDPYKHYGQHAHTELMTISSSLNRTQSRDDHDDFVAVSNRFRNFTRAKRDYHRYLKYLMSLGLPFLHRVHMQIKRDGSRLIPKNYPPLLYRSLSGLRDTWEDMEEGRTYNISTSYSSMLKYDKAGYRIVRKSAVWPAMDKTEAESYCAGYLSVNSRLVFRSRDLWRAGCYFWDRHQQDFSGGSEGSTEQLATVREDQDMMNIS